MLAIIIGFGLIVFIHELGHFLTAIWFGVDVEKFSIGMGPAILKYKYKNTQYQIGLLPLGGFCQFKDDNELEDLPKKIHASEFEYFKSVLPSQYHEDFINLYKINENEEYVLEHNSSSSAKDKITKKLYALLDMRKYRNKTTFFGVHSGKRIVIAFAGSAMNFLLALFLLAFVFMIPHTQLYLPNKIITSEDITKKESSAYQAGMRTGDIIKKINKTKITSFQDISEAMMLATGKKEINVLVEREGEELQFVVHPDWDPAQLKPMLGVYYYNDAKIKFSKKNDLMTVLGLQDNDRIIAINGDSNLVTDVTVEAYLAAHFKTNTFGSLTLLRDNETIELPLDFMELSMINDDSKLFHFDYNYPIREIKGLPIHAALWKGGQESIKNLYMTYNGLVSLAFRPKEKVSNQLGGPIKIGYLMKNITEEGFKKSFLEGLRNFFMITAFISLALSFFNLLPLPALDGGYIIMSLYELIRKKAVRLKSVALINAFGFIILLSLGLLVAFMDVQFLLKM